MMSSTPAGWNSLREWPLSLSSRVFELTVQNSRWKDARDCQLTPETRCNVTFDLGSDSDYYLQVRARCGCQESSWTRTGSPFNRRDSETKARSKRKAPAERLPTSLSAPALLTAPLMEVTSEGCSLQVSLGEPPINAVVTVTIWRRGEELQVRLSFCRCSCLR